MDVGKVGKSSGAQRCPRCLRNKDKAIRAQLERGCTCGDAMCIFAREIEEAIEKQKNTTYCINCGTKFINSADAYCYKCGVKK